MSTPSTSFMVSPCSCNPVRMRFAETPASIRIWVSPSETSVQFPVEPLAKRTIFIQFRLIGYRCDADILRVAFQRDVRANTAQLADKIFIAALNIVDVYDFRQAFGT